MCQDLRSFSIAFLATFILIHHNRKMSLKLLVQQQK